MRISLKWIVSFCLLISLTGCFKGKKVDIIIHNARIHTFNEKGDVAEAMAIKDGKIVEVGPERQILNRYRSEEEIDAGGKDIYPGLTDAHGHIIDLAKRKLSADLTGTRSYDELLVRLEKYGQLNNSSFIVGRGLDTSLWNSTERLTNERINTLFPKAQVCLFFVGEEAAFANKALLQKAKITENEGTVKNQELNQIVKITPTYSSAQLKKVILEIQNELLQYGITGVHEAGVSAENLQLFKSLVKTNQLKLNLYAMLSPSEKNYQFAKKQLIQRFKNLSIRSFFADDTTPLEELKRISLVCEATGYQMSVSSGDPVKNNTILELYASINQVNKDHRWRIENAQNLTSKEYNQLSKLGVFASIIPNASVQYPTTQVALKSILNQTGMIAIGSNFPFQPFNPSITIHSAVQGLNSDNSAIKNISPRETLSLDESIKGMTTWAAYSSFEENLRGTIEKGKEATFVVFEFPVLSGPEMNQNYASMTFIKGKKVYSVE
jgi:predicted amidohydrolase YtcJ